MSFFNFQIVSPTFLTSIQLDEIVAIAIRAYDTNPTIRAMTGGNKALYDPFLRAVTRALLLEGKVWLAASDGRILGVLGGFGPGTFLWATEEQRALGFNNAYARLTEETKYWWQNIYGPQIKEFMDNALGATANLDGWMTPLLAVDPPYQRRGIATAMFKEMTQQAIQDKAIMIVGADSDLNVGIYESFGFELKGRTVLPSSVKGESQPLFALKKIP
ncbi:uncharacterized protein BT62DRAFT_1078480 [Guyanagaster necrorhizus]|uniref:N-acetyltransferase domain-containing protein n=1 Tax=Guyanagaster necrorhizus TaxID=856835 RepID=A0A9P7VML9_9AGAR|nr:uncharacterized protein BT62DRAFT_1078480 [Guyanagaster necrorhizus MCA 3950]KAG7443402.1 hypothetical protein BT62DRAFT_1078480 [Guyanagaster necrorhizus MCA 3950]